MGWGENYIWGDISTPTEQTANFDSHKKWETNFSWHASNDTQTRDVIE